MSCRAVPRAAALGAVAASTLAATLASAARAQSPTLVRVGASLDDGITPVLYGISSGIYKQAGLDVQMQAAENGASLASAIAAGAIDIAKSGMMALITAHAHNIFFKMVAGAALYSDDAPATELCVLKDSPIKSFVDLAGKTIAMNSLQSLDMLGTEALIDQYGGNSAASKYIELPSAAMLGALEQGRADIAEIINPALTEALASGKIRALAPPQRGLGKRLLIGCWFCTAQYAKANPDVVKKFGAATRLAAIYTNAHHAETVPILAAYSHLNPDVIRRMNRTTNATTLIAAEVQPAIDAAVKYKLIPSSFPATDLFIEAYSWRRLERRLAGPPRADDG